MKGRDKCKILKEIRMKIAEENGIEFAVSNCTHKGDCRGTCPKCESEVKYLEKELEKRKRLGKSVAVAGVAAGITLSSVGCSYVEEKINPDVLQGDMQVETVETVDGLLAAEEDDVLMGEPTVEMGEIVEIQGDLAPAPFLPDEIEYFDDYDEFFINESLSSLNIEIVREAWGEEDMSQKKSGESIASYFTEKRDIVIYYDDEGIITRVETIENE
jgi:hypothetical protein